MLVSDYFDEEDYIREHEVFRKQLQAQQKDPNEYSGGSITLEKVVTISQRREPSFHDSAEDWLGCLVTNLQLDARAKLFDPMSPKKEAKAMSCD